MTRRRKLLTAGFILATGLVLAWPFRKSPGEGETVYPPNESPSDTSRASNGDPIVAVPTVPVAPEQVPARVASTNEAENTPPAAKLESFDLANHPAIANVQLPSAAEPGFDNSPAHTLPADSKPVYPTVEGMPTDRAAQWPAELIHVVANGDTLEKLAERYLNDSGRALEIFDLNRDQLTNPHLLPIGVELRVPADPGRIID